VLARLLTARPQPLRERFGIAARLQPAPDPVRLSAKKAP